jgi:RimJ/RimL family protein N-acetyltransferase
MTIEQQLFEGTDIRFGPIDHDKDPEVESRWTHDLSYLRMLGRELARPLSQAQLKKKYEGIEKGMEERNQIYYTIRRKEDDGLLGFVRLFWIEWSHGAAQLQMGIGDPAERGKGYGSQALGMILRFAFDELNLYRLTAVVGEDNPRGVNFFQKFGFVEEVRRRKALLRDGQTYDLLMLGLIKDEWRRE